MGELLTWWLEGGDWYDRRQGRRLDELASSHASAQQSLRSSLNRQSKEFGSQFDELKRALLAMVELEDTRDELLAFADAAKARRYARSVLGRLTSLGGDSSEPMPAPPTDVDGYWVVPAAQAAATMLGDGADDVAALLGEARRRDRRRTDLFVACVAGLAERDSKVVASVDDVLPAAADVTAIERAIWIAAANGRYGPDSTVNLITRLRSIVDESVDDDTRQARLRSLVSRITGANPKGQTPLDAGNAIAALRQWVERVADTEPREVEPQPAPADGRVDGSVDGLAEAIAVLVNEGAPGEHSVLVRMTEIRNALATIGVRSTPSLPAVDEPAGEAWKLLLDDLDSSEPSGAGRRQVAFAVVAPWVQRHAESLAELAAVPPATVSTVHAFGKDITVKPEGPKLAELAKLPASPHPSTARAWMRPASIGLAVVAVAFVALGFAVAPGLWALALLAAAGAAFCWFQLRSDTAVDERERNRWERGERDRLDQATASLAATVAETERVTADAPQHLAAIRAACDSVHVTMHDA